MKIPDKLRGGPRLKRTNIRLTTPDLKHEDCILAIYDDGSKECFKLHPKKWKYKPLATRVKFHQKVTIPIPCGKTLVRWEGYMKGDRIYTKITQFKGTGGTTLIIGFAIDTTFEFV